MCGNLYRSLKSRQQKEPRGRDLRKGKIHYSSVDDDEDDVSADQRYKEILNCLDFVGKNLHKMEP